MKALKNEIGLNLVNLRCQIEKAREVINQIQFTPKASQGVNLANLENQDESDPKKPNKH